MHVHIIFTILLLSLYHLSNTMANYQIKRPKFNWDTKEKLVELENFKTDVTIILMVHTIKMENNEKTSIVLNWLGRQAPQIIKSQGITPRTPKEIYEKTLRPESNDTMAKFRFQSMKQKQSQSVDAYLTDLRLMIQECNYHKNALDDLLKDQCIFGITVKEIQYSLLSKIASDDSIGKCLLEARKIKFQIKQRKLLGIKANVNYDVIGTFQGNQRHRSKDKG